MIGKKIFLIILFFLLTLINMSAVSAQNKIAEETTTTQPKKSPAEEKKVEPINYKKYIENPAELGMSPQPQLFLQMLNILKSSFYGTVEDGALVKSIQTELSELCKAAKVENITENITYDKPENIYKDALQIKDIPQDLIIYACICGLLKGSGDPFTVYMTPKEYGTLLEQLQSSSFGGIGIFLMEDKDNGNMLTVLEPIEGTPAYEAGLQTGDVITEIDGVSTKNVPSDISIAKLRGEKGSPVVLTIERKGLTGARKITIYRDSIQVKSVSGRVIDENIGYIKIRNFGEQTANEFEKTLQDLTTKGIKGLIIDLRNNGGGYVRAATDISGMFLPANSNIVTVKSRTGKEQTHRSKGGFHSQLPLVVLVNKYSASASEITAGALQDYHRGVLVGSNTFGKGSVQQVIPFRDGSALKITLFHYYTPNGNHIDKIGLQPDISVELEPKDIKKDNDPQLRKAEEIIKTGQVGNAYP